MCILPLSDQKKLYLIEKTGEAEELRESALCLPGVF